MTDVALKEHIERRIDDLDRRLTDRFVFADTAIAKAERTMNDRLNSMNEFRDALKDQAARMATRAEMDKLDDQIQTLQRAKANLDGRLLILSGCISLIVTIGMWALTRVMK